LPVDVASKEEQRLRENGVDTSNRSNVIRHFATKSAAKVILFLKISDLANIKVCNNFDA
jgi:hypothetical protein